MIVPDVNILVYAYNSSAPLHKRAVDWWKTQVNSGAQVGICWPVLQGFIRLLGSRRVVPNPYTSAELFSILDQWWSRPTVRLLGATESTYSTYRNLMEGYNLTGALHLSRLLKWNDAMSTP